MSKHNAEPAPLGEGAGLEQTLFTVDQLSEAERALGKGAIRHDLFHRHSNGLAESGAIVYRGRRLLLHRGRYLAWLTRRSQRAG